MTSVNVEKLTEGLQTKSDKIRALAQHGVPTAEIARHLGIRYQHARNVLMESGLHKVKSSAPAEALSTSAKPERRSLWTNIDAEGQLVLPADLLHQAGLKPNGQVYIAVTEDGLELLSQAAALRRVHKITEKYCVPGVSVVDQFIADRRKEWGEV